MRTVHGHESPLQLQTLTVRGPDACGCGLSVDVKFVDPHTSDVMLLSLMLAKLLFHYYWLNNVAETRQDGLTKMEYGYTIAYYCSATSRQITRLTNKSSIWHKAKEIC